MSTSATTNIINGIDTSAPKTSPNRFNLGTAIALHSKLVVG